MLDLIKRMFRRSRKSVPQQGSDQARLRQKLRQEVSRYESDLAELAGK